MHSLLVALMVVVTPAQPAAPDADTRELLRLETVWNEAQLHGDAEALDRLWAADLEVAVPKMPVMKKAEALGFARTGRMAFQSYDTSNLRVRVYGAAAVVTGRLQRERTMGGKSLRDDWRFTKTYIKEGGAWRVVSFHASDGPQP